MRHAYPKAMALNTLFFSIQSLSIVQYLMHCYSYIGYMDYGGRSDTVRGRYLLSASKESSPLSKEKTGGMWKISDWFQCLGRNRAGKWVSRVLLIIPKP